MIIYTDGSADNLKSKCGGWAFAIYTDKDATEPIVFKSGNEQNTTSNRMELTAMINGINMCGVQYSTVYTDSAYIYNCFKDKWYVKWRKNGWINSKKQPVLNKDLWEKLIEKVEQNEIKIEKTKAHMSDSRNNFVDELAVKARRSIEN